jgi:hypothetical protein
MDGGLEELSVLVVGILCETLYGVILVGIQLLYEIDDGVAASAKLANDMERVDRLFPRMNNCNLLTEDELPGANLVSILKHVFQYPRVRRLSRV